MPGPVSDSYDPEFGTGGNASKVREGLLQVQERLTTYLGDERKYIVEVAEGPHGRVTHLSFSERELRLMRFAVDRALEDV